MKRTITGASLLGVGLIMLANAASAETWRFGIEETKGSVQYKYATEFKKRIESKSNGDINVQIFPYGQWGSVYSALYDAVQSGAIQIAFGSGALGSSVPESQLLSLNYVMPSDQWQTAKVLNSDKFLHSDAWEKSFTKRGLYPLANLAEGYQVWTTNKPVHEPADIDGLNIRTMDNSLLMDTYRKYGAAPSSIAYGELYSAMQQGQVEGNIQPVWAHENMGFYEVQDYIVFAKQAQFIAAMFSNHGWYEDLSADQQKMIQTTTDELVRYGYKTEQQLNEGRLQTIKDKSDIQIIRLTPQQQDKFSKLARPERKDFVEDVGQRGKKALNILLKAFDKSTVD